MKLGLAGRSVDPGRIFCIGRNYEDHVREMGSKPPAEPVVFMKPRECLVAPGTPIPFPPHGGELHHEAEVVILIGDRSPARPAGWERVAGVALGIDLTLRDVQARLKAAGLPWEAAKAFESSAPLGDLVATAALASPDEIVFECRVNGALRQQGSTADMIFPVPRIIEALETIWRLRPGDLIYTGTPAGVGPLRPGDRVEIASPAIGTFGWEIESAVESVSDI